MSRRNFAQLAEAIESDPERRARAEQYERAMADALAIAEALDGLRARNHAPEVEEAGVGRGTGPTLRSTLVDSPDHQHEGIYLPSLAQYVTELGGHLEIAAIFPEGTVRHSSSQAPANDPNSGDGAVPARRNRR